MIDSAGTNHFVTLMIIMNYSCILKIGMSHTKVHISPGGGGGYCHICYIGTCMSHCEGLSGFQAVYSGMVYKSESLGLESGVISRTLINTVINCLKILV